MIHASSVGSRVGRLGVSAVPPPLDGEAVPDDRVDVRLAEDRGGPLVRVVGVDRDVGGAGDQDGGDGDVQLGGAGADPHSHAAALADPHVTQQEASSSACSRSSV